MGITGGFGTLIDLVTGRPRRWYMRADGIRRWVSNDQPCDTANESDLWRCTVCGRTGTVGRCCGEETREPVRAPNWQLVDNPIRRYYSAAQRHLAAFRRARFDTKNPFDAIDTESKLHHLAHAACCILFLLWHERKELCEEDAAGTILTRLVDTLAAARTKATIDLFETEMSAVCTETADTPETDAEFDDALNTLRDLGVIREGTTREPLWGDSMAGKTKKQQEKLNTSLRAEVEAYYSAEPVLVREITDEIKFATYDHDALDKLTVRDVPEIERKAFGALDKGKNHFKAKGVKFVRIA